jgi:hypothetical protein
MSDSPPPSPPGECLPPTFVEGEDTLAGWRGGWGVNIVEDARHSSVIYLYRILFGSYYLVRYLLSCTVSSPPCRRVADSVADPGFGAFFDPWARIRDPE